MLISILWLQIRKQVNVSFYQRRSIFTSESPRFLLLQFRLYFPYIDYREDGILINKNSSVTVRRVPVPAAKSLRVRLAQKYVFTDAPVERILKTFINDMNIYVYIL